MSRVPPTIFTVGHSNHDLAVFIAIIRAANIQAIIDVRSFPRSRTNPQFNTDALDDALALHQIDYSHWPDLGGRRNRQDDVHDRTNGFWTNRSFHNYADYALSAQFQLALDRLVTFASDRRPALMCSEAVWWRCHRRIITDYLIARGSKVHHIMGEGKISEARLTHGAVIGDDGLVRYPEPAP